jgi:hypothetical protein
LLIAPKTIIPDSWNHATGLTIRSASGLVSARMIVVDARIAAKWCLNEPGSTEAVALRTYAAILIAPGLIRAEGNGAILTRDVAAYTATGKQLAPMFCDTPINCLAMGILCLLYLFGAFYKKPS